MKKTTLLALGVVLLSGCAVHRYHSDFEFAAKLAREGLWQEAVFRLEKARAAGNDSAALHNNLAVALESLGRLEEAEREYQLAQERARGNGQIESNYKQFKKSHGKAADAKK